MRSDEFERKFRALDINGDAMLDFAEVKDLLMTTGGLTEKQATALYRRVDRDASGLISYDELCEYVLSHELSTAKEAARNKTRLVKWDGPEQLKVNGSWDRETRLALQEFLAVQNTPTARVVKHQKFVTGSQLHASHIIVLQELLQVCEVPSAIEKGPDSLACGVWSERTTRALHELLLMEGAPTAVRRGEAFTKEKFGRPTVIALQELLAMTRRSRGTALSFVR